MPHYQVEVIGSDGRVERLEADASSVFDAGYQAVERFAKLSWWDDSKPVTVQREGSLWRFRPARLSEWKRRQSRHYRS